MNGGSGVLAVFGQSCQSPTHACALAVAQPAMAPTTAALSAPLEVLKPSTHLHQHTHPIASLQVYVGPLNTTHPIPPLQVLDPLDNVPADLLRWRWGFEVRPGPATAPSSAPGDWYPTATHSPASSMAVPPLGSQASGLVRQSQSGGPAFLAAAARGFPGRMGSTDRPPALTPAVSGVSMGAFGRDGGGSGRVGRGGPGEAEDGGGVGLRKGLDAAAGAAMRTRVAVSNASLRILQMVRIGSYVYSINCCKSATLLD